MGDIQGIQFIVVLVPDSAFVPEITHLPGKIKGFGT
jgi:hypothetical protein